MGGWVLGGKAAAGPPHSKWLTIIGRHPPPPGCFSVQSPQDIENRGCWWEERTENAEKYRARVRKLLKIGGGFSAVCGGRLYITGWRGVDAAITRNDSTELLFIQSYNGTGIDSKEMGRFGASGLKPPLFVAVVGAKAPTPRKIPRPSHTAKARSNHLRLAASLLRASSSAAMACSRPTLGKSSRNSLSVRPCSR